MIDSGWNSGPIITIVKSYLIWVFGSTVKVEDCRKIALQVSLGSRCSLETNCPSAGNSNAASFPFALNHIPASSLQHQMRYLLWD